MALILPLRRGGEHSKVLIGSDIDGNIVSVLGDSETVSGWTKENLIGKKMESTLIPTSWRDQHLSGMERFRETGEAPVLGWTLAVNVITSKNVEHPIWLTVLGVNEGTIWGLIETRVPEKTFFATNAFVDKFLFLVLMLIAGIYGLFFAAPITPVEESLGREFYDIWIILATLSPIALITGLILRQNPEREYPGILFQLSGEATYSLVAFAYVTATFIGINFGQGLYAGFAFIAIAIVFSFITYYDAKLFIKYEKKARHFRKAIRRQR